jgi:hypothetical protein
MLKKLKAHWKVNGINLVLIIATFALGGSLCGYAGRKLLLLTNVDKGLAWIFLYILLITLLWPICVILISIPLGQFAFFKRYLIKVWKKMSGGRNMKLQEEKITRIAIFASGAGSNAEQIIKASATFPLQPPLSPPPAGGEEMEKSMLYLFLLPNILSLLSFIGPDSYRGTLVQYFFIRRPHPPPPSPKEKERYFISCFNIYSSNSSLFLSLSIV